jgi:hypothetical protein
MLHLDMNCIHGHTSLNKDCSTDSLNYVKNNLAVVLCCDLEWTKGQLKGVCEVLSSPCIKLNWMVMIFF